MTEISRILSSLPPDTDEIAGTVYMTVTGILQGENNYGPYLKFKCLRAVEGSVPDEYTVYVDFEQIDLVEPLLEEFKNTGKTNIPVFLGSNGNYKLSKQTMARKVADLKNLQRTATTPTVEQTIVPKNDQIVAVSGNVPQTIKNRLRAEAGARDIPLSHLIQEILTTECDKYCLHS